jgi:hypothetical protein
MMAASPRNTMVDPTPLPPLTSQRRQRIHELVVALMPSQSELELLAGDSLGIAGGEGDPGLWLERNRRVVQRYQALVHSALTLDALIDQEVGRDP